MITGVERLSRADLDGHVSCSGAGPMTRLRAGYGRVLMVTALLVVSSPGLPVVWQRQ